MPQKRTTLVHCSHCGKPKWTYPADAKRHAHQFCDHACRGAFLKNRVEVHCAHCGATKSITPAHVNQSGIYFCNNACKSLYRDPSRGVRVTCLHCNSERQVPPSRANRSQTHFCDNKCMRDYYTEHPDQMPARKNATPRLVLTCDECGCTTTRKPSHAPSPSSRVFCSRACMTAFRSRLPEGKRNLSLPTTPPSIKVEKVCDECGVTFSRFPSRVGNYDGVFCSRACKYANARKPDIHVTRTCATCSSEYQTTTHQVNYRGSRFCSKECMDAGLRTRSHPYAYYWRKIKPLVRQRDNHMCQVCGKHQTKPALSVHHIKRAGDFSADEVVAANDMSNLITLCQSCHRRMEKRPDELRAILAKRKMTPTSRAA